MASSAPPDLAHEPLTDPQRPHAAGWLARLGRFSARRRRPVLVPWLALTLVAAPLALSLTSALSGTGWDPQGIVAAEVRDELRSHFADLGAEAAMVVYRQDAPIAEDPSGLLLVVFRSLPIAGASVILNLVSVAASFGFATLVFQHGFGAGLIGIEHQGFVDAWAPLFFFALLFGLSMGYQLSAPALARPPAARREVRPLAAHQPWRSPCSSASTSFRACPSSAT